MSSACGWFSRGQSIANNGMNNSVLSPRDSQLGEVSMSRNAELHRRGTLRKIAALLTPLASLLFLIAMLATGVVAQESPLGSLTSTGDVMINALPAPPDTTVFSKDVIRVGDSGSSTFTLSGKGSITVLPHTQVTLTGDLRYLAELQSGTVLVNSIAGATDVTLRVGDFVVSPVITSEKSSSRVEKMADGSVSVSCFDGSVSVVPIQGATGRVLQTNQTVNISSAGELGLIQVTPAGLSAAAQPVSSAPANAPATVASANSHKTTWIILGVAGGGAAAGIAAAAAGHGGSSTVSPSAP